jgi:hypothetical protein
MSIAKYNLAQVESPAMPESPKTRFPARRSRLFGSGTNMGPHRADHDSLREYWASEVVELSLAALAHNSPTRTGDERHRALLHAGVLAPARPLLPPGIRRRPNPLPGPARPAGPLPYPNGRRYRVEACESHRPR